MFRNIKLTMRNLCRNGVYSIINIVGLAVSLATCAFIVLWVQDETSYDKFHRGAENIYMVAAHFKIDGMEMDAEASSGLFAPTAQENFGTVEEYCRIKDWDTGYLRYEHIKSSSISCFYADPNFFDFFNFPIVKGNKESPLRNSTDVVISERLVKALFGDEDPIGKTVSIDNGQVIHITAVMKNMPQNTYLRNVDLVSLYAINPASYYNKALNSWNGCEFLSFLRIKPKTDVTLLAQQVTEKQTVLQGIRSFTLQPLVNLHLYNIKGESEGMKTVRLFQWIAIIILVIACINYVNLVTARASKRHREIGLKKIIGARKMQLFLQLISEAVILFIIAFFIAYILNILLLPVFNQLSGKEITFGLFNGNIWELYLIMLIVIIGLAGIYPAYLLASFKSINVVQIGKTKRRSNSFRKTLVVTQFVASTALIVGTIVLGAQMKYIREKDMGYDREQVLECSLINMSSHFDAVKAELERQPSILGVTRASENVMGVSSGHGFENWEGKISEGISLHTQIRIDTSFVRVMRLNLIEGINFTSTISKQQYILNESAVRSMGLTNPVGKWVDQNDRKIVGVVKDFHFQSLHKKIEPLVMFYEPNFFWTLYVRIRPGNTQQAISALEKLWKQYNPDYTFAYQFLDETFDRIYKSDILTNRLFGIFSSIAILISCLGLLGLVAFTIELKTKEIGIRKVLGASIPDIFKLLSREFLILVGIAILIALPLSYYWMENMLQGFVYRISLSWWMFFAAALITLMLTLLTVSVQAIKAARANPVDAIKVEQ